MIIYKLTSPSGKSYIGQSKKELEVRFKEHTQAATRYQIKKTKNVCRKLYEAFGKYDPDLWTKEVITVTDKENVDSMEEYYIKLYDTIENGYNITKGGKGRKVDTLDESHKKAISESRKKYFMSDEGQKWKETLSDKMKGKNNIMHGKSFTHTEETKNKISEKMQGKNKYKTPWNKGLTDIFSEETLKSISSKISENHKNGKYDYKKMGESRKGFKQSKNQKELVTKALSKKWSVTSPEGITQEIENLTKFCRENGLDQGNLSRGSHKGWKASKINTEKE